MHLYHTRLRLFAVKLRSLDWSFYCNKVCAHGAVEIQIVETNKIFKVNRHWIKAYYENMPVEEIHEVELAELAYTEE